MLILILVIILALALRFWLSFLPGFAVDMNCWYGWAFRLAKLGFSQFYSSDVWTRYTPGYLYILYFLERIKNSLHLFYPAFVLQLFKLPNNLADILTGVLIYKTLVKKSKFWAYLTTVVYIFSPALIFNSSIWGQADSFLCFFLILGFWLLVEKKKLSLAAVILSFAFLIKPQAAFILPPVFIFLFKNFKLKKIFAFWLIFIFSALILSWPFFVQNPIFGLTKMVIKMGSFSSYAATTLNAFNFWQLFGNWQNDNILLFGLPYFFWGIMLYSFFTGLVVFFLLVKKRIAKKDYYLAAAISFFSFFLFPTRIHERYLLFVFPFLIVAVGLKKSWRLLAIYLILGLIHFLNLFYVYNLYYPDFLKIPPFFNLNKIAVLPKGLSFLTLAAFFVLIKAFFQELKTFLIKNWRQNLNSQKNKIRQSQKIKKTSLYLAAILFFSFILRVWNIWYPKAYIFDEVYHGFTAQEIAKGNVKAWEWWNASPKGFAYEWTHPPLAKLIMAGSVLLFGQNNRVSQYAFRFPSVLFGVGVIYLTYLLAKKIFKNEIIGLIAAFLLCFDGLLFVMSRIGMADVYSLFFLLLTIYFALKEKYLLTGISLGLAIATKWTGIYLYPIISFIFFNQLILKRRQNKRQIFNWLLILIIFPFIVYVLSYSLFFSSGHNFSQFIELQKQMWWYHTHLKATHSYQSKAWSWPLMLRPVWFWVGYKQDKIANIYNLGNPILWWTGILALLMAVYKIIIDFWQQKKLNFQLGFIILAYFAFWLPWLFSPRIMFLHHYLPAMPFLVILIAYFLNKIKDQRLKIKNREIKGKLLVISYWLLVIFCFSFFYPIYTGAYLPKNLLKWWFWLPSWR